MSQAFEDVCVVVKLPALVADQFSSDQEDPHVTVWYQGGLDGNRADDFQDAVAVAVQDVGLFIAELTGEIGYFDNDGFRVAFVRVDPESAFTALFMAIQRELVMRGIVSDSEYYRSAWEYRPHSTVGFLEPDELWLGPAPFGWFEAYQVEIWGFGVPIVVPLALPEVATVLQKSWIRQHEYADPKTGKIINVHAHQDSRTKKPEPPHHPRPAAAPKPAPKPRKKAAPEAATAKPKPKGKLATIREKLEGYEEMRRQIKDRKSKIPLRQHSYAHVGQVLRQQVGATTIELHQARIDHADALAAAQEGKKLSPERVNAEMWKLTDEIKLNGTMDGLELKSPDMYAKVTKEPGPVLTVEIFDENGVAGEQTYKSSEEALKALVKKGFTKSVPGTMEKFQHSVQWLYGNRAVEAIKHAEQVRRTGKNYEATQIEKEFIDANGTGPDEMVTKDEIKQRVSYILNLGHESWDKAIRRDPAEASEVAQVLKRQKLVGDYEKKVERVAASDLLSPEETEQAIFMGMTQDSTERDLRAAEDLLRSYVNGRPAVRLQRRHVDQLANEYMKQLHEHFGDVGALDPDNILNYAETVYEMRGHRFVAGSLGKDYADLIKLGHGPAWDEKRKEIMGKTGTFLGDDFIRGVIKMQASAAITDKGKNAVSEEISIPVSVIYNGEDVELPLFQDGRIKDKFGDAQWTQGSIESMKNTMEQQQQYLDNWRDHFDTLVDVSRKIMMLSYQLKDLDFHDSPEGITARDLLDHMSRKREDLFGIRTPETRSGDIEFGTPETEHQREEEAVPF